MTRVNSKRSFHFWASTGRQRAGTLTWTRFGVGDKQPRSPAGTVLPSQGCCTAANSNQMCRGLFSRFCKGRNAEMQRLEEDVLPLVSSPLISQLVCCGKTAGVRRNLNFYWAFNECKKQSAFKTWRSLGVLLTYLLGVVGKGSVPSSFQKGFLPVCLVAGGDNSAGPKL